jgi:hypothetical protein
LPTTTFHPSRSRARRIRFSPNGKELRAGFIPVLWNRDASAQVIVVGGVECRYPKS